MKYNSTCLLSLIKIMYCRVNWMYNFITVQNSTIILQVLYNVSNNLLICMVLFFHIHIYTTAIYSISNTFWEIYQINYRRNSSIFFLFFFFCTNFMYTGYLKVQSTEIDNRWNISVSSLYIYMFASHHLHNF